MSKGAKLRPVTAKPGVVEDVAAIWPAGTCWRRVRTQRVGDDGFAIATKLVIGADIRRVVQQHVVGHTAAIR